MECWSIGLMGQTFSPKKVFIISITFALLVSYSSMAAEKLTVFVVNYPLQYFAERIG